MERGKENSSAPEKNVLPVGEIGRPHGIKGEVKVYPYSGNPGNLRLYGRLLVRYPGVTTEESFNVSSCRVQRQFAVVKLEGIDNRDAAGLLTGAEVCIERQEMPELGEDEFYWHDLRGMAVLTLAGRRLGTVRKLLATGAHDILVVADRGQEYMIPALDEFITAIDVETGTITIDPPEGLLEINN